MQSADTIIYSFQPSFHWDALQEAILPGRQARVQVTKTSPVTTTDSNEWKINTNLWESKTISLYYSRGNIFQRGNSIRIPRATVLYPHLPPNWEPCWRRTRDFNTTSSSPNTIRAQNAQNTGTTTNCPSIYTQQQRKTVFSLWASLASGKARLEGPSHQQCPA